MKRQLFSLFTLLLLLLTAATASAQQNRQFSIVSFGHDPFDMTAKNDQYKKIDGSGSLYAIIKVSSATADDNLSEYRFNFGNLNHIVEEKENKLWLYVQRNAKHVTISRKGFTTIERYDLGTTIQEGQTYVMTLKAAPRQVFTQMVMFLVKPEDSKATVTVNDDDVVGITDESGATAKSLPYGSYTYKVMAEGYYKSEGHFTLNDQSQTHTEQIILRPKFALVTLRTTADADIYVNGQLKGRRTWSGRLNGGSYQVECRQQNHRPSSQTIAVKENEPRTYDLTLPTPITGTLSVMSQPLQATITIDNQPMGTTPRQLTDQLIGRHTITVSKAGYENATQQFDITEGQTTNLNIALKKLATATTPVGGNNGLINAATPAVSVNDRTFTVKGVSFVMKAVAGGTFKMGSDDSDAESNEKPVHSVTLSDYMIGETEVTQKLWQAVMGSSPSYYKGTKKPVEKVSWNDCQTFIRRLNKLTGQRFRLPTEAEWEYAARGGNRSRGYKYAGSNNIGEVTWYNDNSGSGTHNVKTKAPNELGIYDMSGNVCEWCQDWYGSYNSSAQTNPTGAATGSHRVLRGGCCYFDARYCRVSNRFSYTPSYGGSDLGLRLAL